MSKKHTVIIIQKIIELLRNLPTAKILNNSLFDTKLTCKVILSDFFSYQYATLELFLPQ